MNFVQIYDLTNIMINRSFLKKRTRDAEEDINKLQLFERNVEAWKIDIEQRMADKFA